MIINNSCQNKIKYDNQYFFKDDILSVTYKGSFMFWNPLNRPIILCINKVASFNDGEVYLLRLNQIEVTEPLDKIPEDRLQLGHFYVTKDKIYRLCYTDNSIYFVNHYKKGITENNFIKESQIVCQEDELKDSLGENAKGWHEFIEIDGDKRRFVSYNNIVNTGFYENIVWEKDKGLIYYRSGYGAGKETIEFLSIKYKI